MRKVGSCLVTIFTPRVMVIKMSKVAHFSHFLLMTAKNAMVWLMKMVWLIGFGGIVLEILRVEILKTLLSQQKNTIIL